MKLADLLGGAVALVIAPAAIQGQELSFRGLTAKSTRAEVKRAFPKAVVENHCKPGEVTSRNAEGQTLCDQLAVTGYLLDNVPFDATFVFNPNGTLRYVSLIKLWGSYRQDGEPIAESMVRSTFASLSDLVSTKYGPAVANPPGSYLPARSSVESELEWQPGRGTEWQAGGDRIKLRSDGSPSRTGTGLSRASIQLFYTFARREELDRF